MAQVTAATVVRYLRAHPVKPGNHPPEFLFSDDDRHSFYLRWPSGATRWESAESLRARGIQIPDRMLLDAE